MMLPEIKRGSTRTVFLTDGYALKVPSHRGVLIGLKKIKKTSVQSDGIRAAIAELLKSTHIDESDWNVDLFKGFYANRIESMFDWSLGDLVEPTIASLAGGFINVQARNTDIVASNNYVGSKIDEAIPGKWPIGVGHTVCDITNFGMSEGRLKLRDYGGVGVVEFLLVNRVAIKAVFDELSEEFVDHGSCLPVGRR